MPAEELLVYQGEVFINFRNHTYQWVSIKLFALHADADDDAVLQLLIRHVRYRASYNGTGDKDMENTHGPYWLRAITPKSFSPVSATDAEPLLRTWAEYAAPLPDARRDDMERELYPRIRSATSCYLLPDLRDTAQHDEGWGSSVGSVTGFFEFVLIDRAAASVALVVASDD
ncbi:hypothetical protein [Mycobacterium angelicum]|uniref:hypothetical protein n=1 Tax=Mycobacterium angelicum TaxID=470074 RepID=UPI00111C3C80|nr:hypothetical protein [Mycobacterium angelicum]MCV7198518.1 hypothetical protein [Mycobacterium angelicum]